MDQDVDREELAKVVVILTHTQFREALARLRVLENASKHSSLGRERDALELAVSRYLAFSERSYRDAHDEPDQWRKNIP